MERRLYKPRLSKSPAGWGKAFAFATLGFCQFSRFSQNWRRRNFATGAEPYPRNFLVAPRGAEPCPLNFVGRFRPFLVRFFLGLCDFQENGEFGRRGGRELRLRFFPGAVAVLRLFRLSWTGLFKLFWKHLSSPCSSTTFWAIPRLRFWTSRRP